MKRDLSDKNLFFRSPITQMNKHSLKKFLEVYFPIVALSIITGRASMLTGFRCIQSLHFTYVTKHLYIY